MSAWDDAVEPEVVWDADARLFVVRGRPWGPAGPARFDLPGGVTLSVDLARPDVLHEFVVEAPLDGDPVAIAAETAESVEVVLGAEPDRLVAAARSRAAVRLGPVPGDQRLSNLAVLSELADELTSELGGIAARLERAGVALDHGAPIVVRAIRADGLVALAALVESLPYRWEWDGGPVDDLIRLGRRVALGLGDDRTAAWLDDLGDHRHVAAALARPAFESYSAGSPEMADVAPAPERSLERAARVVVPERPIEVRGDVHADARLVTSTLVHVRVGWPRRSDRWVRVWRRSDRLVLAFVPTSDRYDDRPARLVVPPGYRPEDLVVDVVDDPGAPVPSPALEPVQEAVRNGRDALRHQRLGEPKDAAVAWRRSASAWDRAGDVERAEVATEYAESAVRNPFGSLAPHTRPYLVDRLR